MAMRGHTTWSPNSPRLPMDKLALARRVRPVADRTGEKLSASKGKYPRLLNDLPCPGLRASRRKFTLCEMSVFERLRKVYEEKTDSRKPRLESFFLGCGTVAVDCRGDSVHRIPCRRRD